MISTSQHANSTVVTSDDHKCAAVTCIEHIVIGKTGISLGFLGMNKCQLLRLGREDSPLTTIQKLHRRVVRCNGSHTSSSHTHRKDEAQHYNKRLQAFIENIPNHYN